VFAVEFAPPKAAMTSTGTVEVSYNGTSPSVSLAGDSVAVSLKAPASQTLPGASPGATGKPVSLTISNESAAMVQLGAPSKLTDFTITSDHCANGSIASKSHCVVTMEFTPAGGTKGQLTSILSYGFRYGANSGSVSVTLKGKVK